MGKKSYEKSIVNVVGNVNYWRCLFRDVMRKKPVARSLSECSYFRSESKELKIPTPGYSTSYFERNHAVYDGKLYSLYYGTYYAQEYADAVFAGTAAAEFGAERSEDGIAEYDLETGELLNRADVSAGIKSAAPSDLSVETASPVAMLAHDDGIIVYVANFEFPGKVSDGSLTSMNARRLESVMYDPASKSFKDYRTYDVINDPEKDCDFKDVVRVGDKDLILCSEVSERDGQRSYHLYFLSNDGTVDEVKLADHCNDSILDLKDFIINGDTLEFRIFVGDINAGSIKYGRINLKDYSVAINDEAGIFNDVDSTSIIGGKDTVSVREEGIYRFNAEKGAMEMFVDFNNADINYYSALNSTVIQVSEDNVFLLNEKNLRRGYMVYFPKNQTIICKVSGTNEKPYKGRKPITVADAADSIDYATAEGIRRFNLTNTKYYVQLSVYHDDDALSGLYAMTDVSNRVIIDLANGNAADVILNGAEYRQFNNPEYLADLSTYAAGLDRSKYFSNIIDASYTGEALYQMPLGFRLKGIRTSAEAADGYGYSLDSYNSFVSDYANGFDPVNEYSGYDKSMYLNEILAAHLGDFVDYSSKTVNFDTESFRNVAGFVNGTNDTYEYKFEFMTMEQFLDYKEAFYGELTPFQIFRSTYHFGDENIVAGLPYGKEKTSGPSALITASAAITKGCKDPDAAWELIAYLASEECQSFNEDSVIPVNRAAYDNVMNSMMDVIGEQGKQYLLEASYSDIDFDIYDGTCIFKPDDSYIVSLGKNIDAVDSIYSADSELMMIINEEMPAYFTGQKSLDDVIQILNNRATLVIKERA